MLSENINLEAADICACRVQEAIQIVFLDLVEVEQHDVFKPHAAKRVGHDPAYAATADDTVQTSIYDRLLERPFPAGINDRVVRNAFNAQRQGDVTTVDPDDQTLLEQLLLARERGDTTVAGVSAGVSSGLITAMQPAADIVDAIVRDAEDLLRQRPRQLLTP